MISVIHRYPIRSNDIPAHMKIFYLFSGTSLSTGRGVDYQESATDTVTPLSLPLVHQLSFLDALYHAQVLFSELLISYENSNFIVSVNHVIEEIGV